MIILLIGGGLIWLSYYINDRVATELSGVRQKTDTLQNNPLTELGGSNAKTATGIASEGINQAAESKAAPYSLTANRSLYIGIGLVAIGGITIIFGGPRKR